MGERKQEKIFVVMIVCVWHLVNMRDVWDIAGSGGLHDMPWPGFPSLWGIFFS
jgi:hypothetical protein